MFDIEDLKRNGKVVMENTSASVIDTGDRIGLIEFHTRANSLDDDICDILVAAAEKGSTWFDALVIGNRGKHFSAGANLQVVLGKVMAGRWKQLEDTILNLQRANLALKHGPLPVVAAPFSNTLGGGCEVCLHSTRVVADYQLHMGLVETGVGLVPAGGGTKELALRALDNAEVDFAARPEDSLHQAFESITHARVTRNGCEAKDLFLNACDIVVPMESDPIFRARQQALQLVHSGYKNPPPRTDIRVVGVRGVARFQSMIEELREMQVISEHDAFIARKVAVILCGGNIPESVAGEQHFLDLEREAFLSLLGTKKTQDRIEYLLLNNKPLRN